MMTHVFASQPYGQNASFNPAKVREKVLKALESNEWVSTGDLYEATLRKVRRPMLHAVLKALLDEREITMRVLKLPIGRDRTEFKLKRPNVRANRPDTAAQE